MKIKAILFSSFCGLFLFGTQVHGESITLQDIVKFTAPIPEMTIYVADEVVTLDPDNPNATAVAVVDDRILAVGELKNLVATAGDQPYSIDRTFANGLRSILRQDPDIILVGEIRDYETAEIAISAALTGHLVLSTLHTNDAAGAVSRLVSLGIPPFQVASSVLGVVAQRLVRVVCPKCKKSYKPAGEEMKMLFDGQEPDKKKTIYKSQGCGSCRNTGYHGRAATYEILNITDGIKKENIKW